MEHKDRLILSGVDSVWGWVAAALTQSTLRNLPAVHKSCRGLAVEGYSLWQTARTHGHSSEQVSEFISDVRQISTGRAGRSTDASHYSNFLTKGVDIVYEGLFWYNQSAFHENCRGQDFRNIQVKRPKFPPWEIYVKLLKNVWKKYFPTFSTLIQHFLPIMPPNTIIKIVFQACKASGEI